MSSLRYNPADVPDQVAILRARVAELERAEAERRDAESALRESRSRLRTVISNAPIVLFAIDRNGTITLSEGKALEALGLKAGEVVGQSIFKLYGHLPRSIEDVKRALSGEAFSSQHELAGVTLEIRFTPLRDASGEVSGVIGVATDVTDRVRAEREKSASEEKFRLLAENVPGIIYLCRNDARFTMLYLNDEVERLTGYPKQDFLDDRVSFADLFHPDDAPLVYRGVDEAVSNGRPFHLTYRIRCRDGRLIWCEEFGVGVFQEGRLAFLEGYITDITQRVRDQQALEEAKADLERRVAERTEHLRIANEKALRTQEELAHVLRVATVGELASGLAHELNQPLSAINNYIQGARRRAEAGAISPADWLTVFEKVAAQSERAASILDTVRRYIARHGEHGDMGHDCRLDEVVKNALKLAEADIRENEVRLEVLAEGEFPTVRCDRVQIEQVVLNLVRNGIEAMRAVPREGRRLRIAVRVVGRGEVEVVVCDSGPGVPPHEAERVFDAFHSTKQGGLGMGLSISRSIVEAHQGRIWLARGDEVSPGACGGAAFHFALPVKGGRA